MLKGAPDPDRTVLLVLKKTQGIELVAKFGSVVDVEGSIPPALVGKYAM